MNIKIFHLWFQSKSALHLGDIELATRKANSARMCTIISVVIGCIWIVSVILVHRLQDQALVYIGGACICLYWWSMHLFILVEHTFVYIGGAYSWLHWCSIHLFIFVEHVFVYTGGAYICVYWPCEHVLYFLTRKLNLNIAYLV